MPVENDDRGYAIYGNNVQALRFYDDNRVLRATIYLDENNRLNVGDLRINTSTGGTGGGAVDLSAIAFVTIAESPLLTNERILTQGDGLVFSDGGGGAAYTIGVNGTVVRTTRQVISGNGLTGGGDLSADRTLAVGAGDGITVAADSVAVDGTVVRTSRTLTAGTLLGGGGTLAADRTFNVELHHVILLGAAGTTAEYAATDAGLTAALAAAGSGDVVILPACSISGGPWAVASGVTLRGQGNYTSILSGQVTVTGGYVSDLDITAAGPALTLTAGASAWRVRVTHTSGAGIAIDSSNIYYCDVGTTSASATSGIVVTNDAYIFAAYVSYNAGAAATHSAVTVSASAYTPRFVSCYINGVQIGANAADGAFYDCAMLGGSYGLYVSGTVAAYGGTASGGTNDVYLTSGGPVGVLTVYGLQYATVGGAGTLTYGRGDRAAYSVEDYHAADIEAAALTRHMPTPPAAGYGVVSDGANWGATAAPIITGSAGSAGYVARFTGAETVGNGILRDSGSSAGLGTASYPSGGGTPVWALAQASAAPTGAAADTTALYALDRFSRAGTTSPHALTEDARSGALVLETAQDQVRTTRRALEVTSGGKVAVDAPYLKWVNGNLQGVSIGTGYTGVSSSRTFSVSCWATLDSFASSASLRYIFGQQASPNVNVLIYATNTGLIRFSIGNGAANLGAFTASSYMTAGAWHHMLFVFNGNGVGNAGRMQVYVDGQAITLSFTGTIPTDTSDITAGTARIGYLSAVTSWDGGIRQFGVYSAALAAADAINLYRGTDVSTSRINYWPMSEGAGTICYDMAGSTDASIVSLTWAQYLGQFTSTPKELTWNGNLAVAGGQRVAIRSISAAYTALDTDFVILGTAGSAGITVTLPPAAANANRVFYIKKVDSGVGAVTVDGNGSETIDGSTTKRIEAQYESITIVCDGSGWYIL